MAATGRQPLGSTPGSGGGGHHADGVAVGEEAGAGGDDLGIGREAVGHLDALADAAAGRRPWSARRGRRARPGTRRRSRRAARRRAAAATARSFARARTRRARTCRRARCRTRSSAGRRRRSPLRVCGSTVGAIMRTRPLTSPPPGSCSVAVMPGRDAPELAGGHLGAPLEAVAADQAEELLRRLGERADGGVARGDRPVVGRQHARAAPAASPRPAALPAQRRGARSPSASPVAVWVAACGLTKPLAARSRERAALVRASARTASASATAARAWATSDATVSAFTTRQRLALLHAVADVDQHLGDPVSRTVRYPPPPPARRRCCPARQGCATSPRAAAASA